LLAQIVFRNDGTLDKFIGDGLMATFGTPDATGKDASNALVAMVEIVEEFDALKQNGKLTTGGDLQLAVGIHYGPVVMGNIGSRERLEFAVLGDTVNVASRLESATRQLGCRGLASGGLIVAAAREMNAQVELTDYRDKLELSPPIKLRGLKEEIEVFKLL